MNLLFTTDNIKGGKNTFKILNKNEIQKNSQKNKTMMNYIKSFISIKNNNINYVKASSTKDYYKNLNKN
jgi:hypothetical protein